MENWLTSPAPAKARKNKAIIKLLAKVNKIIPAVKTVFPPKMKIKWLNFLLNADTIIIPKNAPTPAAVYKYPRPAAPRWKTFWAMRGKIVG